MHEHDFKPTGRVYYVCPLSRRWECACGAYENRSEGPGIEVLTLEEAIRRRPGLYGLPEDPTPEQVETAIQHHRARFP